MSDFNERIVTEFHQNDGRVGPPFEGAHLLLLTTTGARSGETRVSPLAFFTRDETVYVIAAAAGAPTSPAWYHNLVANPRVHVEQATDDGVIEYDAVAEVVSAEDHDRVWDDLVSDNAGFQSYREKTSRVIPIVALRSN